MSNGLGEIFFRPAEQARERLTIPAVLYNQCRLMLARCQYEHIFVPIRSMQIQSVIDEDEVIFVDSQAYAVSQGQGGKLIRLAWEFRHAERGDSLDQPAPIELVYYAADARQLHTRLVGEFAKALGLMEQRFQNQGCEPRSRKILPFRER